MKQGFVAVEMPLGQSSSTAVRSQSGSQWSLGRHEVSVGVEPPSPPVDAPPLGLLEHEAPNRAKAAAIAIERRSDFMALSTTVAVGPGF